MYEKKTNEEEWSQEKIEEAANKSLNKNTEKILSRLLLQLESRDFGMVPKVVCKYTFELAEKKQQQRQGPFMCDLS